MNATGSVAGRLEGTRSEQSARYEAIEDYAAIGDCRSIALVSRRGSIDFLCWPRFDSPALFSSLLDADLGGRFAIAPTQPFESSRHYRPDSNVLVTEFSTARGVARLTDAFFAADEATKAASFLPLSMLMRQIEAIQGEVEFEFVCEPKADFGKRRPRTRCWDKRSYAFHLRDSLVHLALDFDADLSDSGVSAVFTLHEGEKRVAVLSLNESGPAVFPPLPRSDELFETTDLYWREWSKCIRYEGPYRQAVARSALVLKLLCFAPSGAILAAPTTSLPEKLGASYNWDYRYCWLRDASLTIHAFVGVGLDKEAHAFAQWLLHATHLSLPELQVVYNVFGKTSLKEKTLDHLDGYRGSKPVRIGNNAYGQKQLDVYGEVASAITIGLTSDDRLSGDERSFFLNILRYVMGHWREPDAGIWETRQSVRDHVHSKVMCWVALQCGIRLVSEGQIRMDMDALREAAAAIKIEVQQRGFNEELGAYTAAYDSHDLDAAALTLPIVGFEDARSPRMTQTIETLRRVLARDELIFRHQNAETDGEGAFMICSFWLVECLALQGRLDEANELFQKLLGRMNDVGLYPEEIDPYGDGFLGNFPQAFTHVGLINAALRLHPPREEERRST